MTREFFRAGHAHAGVIVILSLICQMLADAAVLPIPLLWVARIGVPLSAILISALFCAAASCDSSESSRFTDLFRSGHSCNWSYCTRHWIAAITKTCVDAVERSPTLGDWPHFHPLRTPSDYDG
jgi:hypothetical protein